MDTRERKITGVITAVMIFLILAWIWPSLQISGGIPYTGIFLFMLFILVGLSIFGKHMSSSREAEEAEPMTDPTASPVYYDYEESPSEVFESKTPVFSCPDCGHENPGDADFCIRCGRDLDITDDVARY
ncbi:MAG: zinc ribbon domain-containing protein [Candidatus Hodarchaeota archaeon]